MKRAKVFMVLAVSLLLLSGCSKDSGKTEVRIAYFPNITHAQALVMKAQSGEQGSGLAAKLGEDYELEWLGFNAGPAEVEALFAGEVDIGYIGPVPAINAYIKSGGDVKIVAGASKAGAVLLTRTNAEIHSVSELSGKNVAVPQLGNTQHISLLKLLTDNGLAPKSDGGTVNIVPAANADIQNLMGNGDVDAALVPEPWGSILEREAGANILLDYDEIWMDGDYDVAVVIVNKDFLEKHPDIVEKVLAEHQAATAFIKENPDEAKNLINQEIEAATGKALDSAVLDTAFGRLVISDRVSKESIDAFAKINFDQGLIKELPGEGLIDESLLKE